MLIVKVANGKIDKAVKQMRRKVNKTKLKRRLVENKYHTKKSEKNRLKIRKAKYIQGKQNEAED